MKYESFTGVALNMLHDAVRRAIVMDQLHIKVGKPPPCETSSTEEWRKDPQQTSGPSLDFGTGRVSHHMG
jgi:hypothetical protein